MNFALILENIKAFWHLGVIALLLIVILTQHEITLRYKLRLAEANSTIQSQTQFIEQYKADAEAEAKSAKIRAKEAAKIRSAYTLRLKEINNATVSDRCEEAKEWAIEEAQKLY